MCKMVRNCRVIGIAARNNGLHGRIYLEELPDGVQPSHAPSNREIEDDDVKSSSRGARLLVQFENFLAVPGRFHLVARARRAAPC